MIDNAEWLYNDVQKNRKVLEANDSQLARRNYLRSLSAFYEFALSNLRETTAELLVDEFELSGKWKIHEIYPLMDNVVRLSDNGKLNLDVNRLPFLPLVAYTLKTYAKQIGLDKDILSDDRWNAFRETVRIRNRISHPKFSSEIEITDEELKVIDNGWAWWREIMYQFREAYIKKMVGG